MRDTKSSAWRLRLTTALAAGRYGLAVRTCTIGVSQSPEILMLEGAESNKPWLTSYIILACG